MVGLCEEQVQQFERDGFLIVRGYASLEETKRLRDLAWKYASELEGSEVFTTNDQSRRTGDKFMDSAYGIASFLEEEALDESGNLTRPLKDSINKIGHALHELDPDVRRFTGRCGDMATSLGMKEPTVVQSMFIFKQPRIGGEVRAHRDSTFLWTDPPSCMAYWIALEDTTTDNGCLHAVPGSHRDPVEQRFAVTETGEKPAISGEPLRKYEEASWASLPMNEGDLILIHGAVLHRSAANRSQRTRLAYTFHIIESKDCLWSPQNWLQRAPEAPFPSIFDLADGTERRIHGN
mmetsp:Transcript_22176/g.89744  ORF Transcript_22176/g.89744 Transcript_22176/m.89744 type:complete len:292 (-) Transcript_22176:337-1212(-)